MNLLILKGFNNYFNRIIKRYTTLSDYNSHSEAHYDFSNINFNPNDGVTTTQIIGSENQKQIGDGIDPVPLKWEYEGSPDYLIAYETEQVGGVSTAVIKSRWFIVESDRTRNGQYNLKLKRDNIADHFDSLLNCPAYIKRGIVDDDNPLILNNEGINVNQIKQGQEPLMDDSNSAWIVGYMPKNLGTAGDGALSTLAIPDDESKVKTLTDFATEFGVSEGYLASAISTSKSPSKFIKNIEVIALSNPGEGYNKNFHIAVSADGLQTIQNRFTVTKAGAYLEDCCANIQTTGFSGDDRIGRYISDIWTQQVRSNLSTIRSHWNSYTSVPLLTKNLYNALLDWVGNYIYKNGQYYRLQVGQTTNESSVTHKITNAGYLSTMTETFIGAWNTWAWNHPSQILPYVYNQLKLTSREGGKTFISYSYVETVFYLEPASVGEGLSGNSFQMSTSRNACNDAVYDMFAIPYHNTTIIETDNSTFVSDGSLAQRLAVLLAGAAEGIDSDTYALYDLQLLPYCPIPELITEEGIDLGECSQGEHYDYDYISYTGNYNTSTTHNSSTTTNEYAQGQWEGTATWLSSIQYDKVQEWGVTLVSSQDIQYAEEWLSSVQKSLTNVGGNAQFQIYAQVQDYQEFDDNDIVVQFWVTYETYGTIHTSIVLYPKSATFKTKINKTIALKDEVKIEALCNNYRLVSPNYQGSFDFNVAKNGGSVNSFTADCTYKPYTPYIKVVPELGWMYGVNYHDCRGLICGGDFSLGKVNSYWSQYQLNNKNYQNIFNREIQNLDVAQSIQRIQQYTTGGLGIVRDTIAGGMAGGLATGSPYGAIAGAVLGGVGSGIGYGVDMSLMETGSTACGCNF